MREKAGSGSNGPGAVDFETFVLEFMQEAPEGDEGSGDGEDIEGLSPNEMLDRMKEAIPASVREIGQFDDEVENWTSWKIEDHFYVMPWEGSDFDWALFGISWDDNWGRYEWRGLARVAGYGRAGEAARVMLEALFRNWGMDPDNPEYAVVREFLEGI